MRDSTRSASTGWWLGRGTVEQKGGAAARIAAEYATLKEFVYDVGFSVHFTFAVLEEDCDGLYLRYLIEMVIDPAHGLYNSKLVFELS